MPVDTYKKHCTKQRSFLVLMTYTVSALIYLMDGAFSQAEFSFIRHERSRIRHSNGKDYTRWGLHVLNNLTFQYESNSMQYDLFENESSILTANDPWLLENITDHSSVRTQYPDKSPEKNTTSFTFLSFLPKNRKNANKKILKNIQKTIDKGIRYLQSHNDLNEEDKNDSTHLSSIQIQALNKPLSPEVEPVLKNFNSRTTAGLAKIEESQSLVDNFNSRNNSGVNYEDFFILSNDEYRTQTQMTDGAFPTANQKQEGFDDDYLIQHIEDLSSLDEISRSNRLNLLQGRDVVTKFLQIVESQHMLGANCTAGTALNLGDGVVDQYAQDRFRIEAEVAVNRANMLTRIFKQASFPVQASEHLLHASVLSMVEFDEDIFAAGNCFDWNQHPSKPGLFCPFAYRLPPPDQGAAFAKDLAAEYHYLGNTSEWFFLARKNAEKVIARNNQYSKAYHYYSNSTAREADVTLTVRYEDGRWSKPYYDCGGGNIWMLTFTVPFFGFANGSYFFKGTSGIDIDLRRVDIDQCPQKVIAGVIQPINIFAGTDKCKQRTTMCEPIPGLGFRRGSYKCVCRKGFYFPNGNAHYKYFNGSVLEEEYEKLMLNEPSAYSTAFSYECRQCAEGCDSCKDSSPCVATLNWHMRTSILVLACFVIGLLPPAAWFTVRYHEVKVVRAASPVLLRVIALGAFFIYSTTIVMYPPPTLYTCTARVWLREIGFSLTYGALMLKTWRISVIFRVRSAKAVKITDAALMKRLGMICCIIGIFLLIRTIVSPPEVVVGYTPDDLKTFLCKTDWWDYTFTTLEVLFLGWGVRLCIMVRKAPSEFNESRFISMAIYNEFLLTCFLNVSMMFLQSPANPDLLYIIFFCHTQLTVTLLLGLIFGSKIYIVLRNGKMQENTIGLGSKASVGKFSNRKQIKAFNNPSTATSSTLQIAEVRLSDQEVLDEILQLNIQLQRIQDLIAPKTLAANTVSVLLESIKAAIQTINSKAPLTNSLLLPTFSGVETYQDVRVCKKTVDKSVNTINAEDIFSHMMELDRTNQPHCPKQVNDIHFISDQDTCVDFSELYLECMCARPDEEFACDADLNLDCKGAAEIPTYFQRNKSSKRLDKNLEINEGNCFPQIHNYESQGIADNDEEYVLKKHCQHLDTHKSRLEASQQQIKTFSETNECQVIKQETSILNCKNHNDKPPSQSHKLDKLVLDLNDRSKYTKEVSV